MQLSLKFRFFVIFLLNSIVLLNAQEPIALDAPSQSYSPSISKGECLGDIPALRDLAQKPHTPEPLPSPLARRSNYFFANSLRNQASKPAYGDPLYKQEASNRDELPEITPGFNFEGIREAKISPPDPSGDVGKNHYVQMVNYIDGKGAWLQVWDKNTAQPVLGPLFTGTIWSQVGSASIGDPIVQYDHDAERWIIMEMKGYFANELLIAISNNSDPTDGWKAYRFQTFGYCDYPKLYIWPDAYFVTTNEIVYGSECAAYAIERSALLAGAPSFGLLRFVMPNYKGIQFQPATGADWEGNTPPPPGSPGYLFRLYDDAWDGGQDQLQFWEIKVDWNNPGLSHISGPEKLFPTPFETKVCFGIGITDCIEQPDPEAPRITALESIILHRAPYRNFGDYESVVLSHVSDVSSQVGEGGDAAVRWYELRKIQGGNWQIFQEGVYAPDLVTNRFMATICSDEAGNIALGYTGASQSLYPGLYLTGRRVGDPSGEMTMKEFTLAAGEQSHFEDTRWGDYSSMSIDPEDGKTFWFTGEYQPLNANWGTRIGSFRIQTDSYDLKPQALLSPLSSAHLSNQEMVQIQLINGGTEVASDFSMSLYLEGNLIATEFFPGVIPPGSVMNYTFLEPLSLSTPGKNYPIQIITHWAEDQYAKNDTLESVVSNLFANDVAVLSAYALPDQVCWSETDFGIVIQNASGLPLESAQIHWQWNNQASNLYNWTGNLPPGAKDTLTFHAVNLKNGPNQLEVFTTAPNAQADERTSNDTLSNLTMIGNLDGMQLLASVKTDFGVLSWELRSLNQARISGGEISGDQALEQICTEANTCYYLALCASTYQWQGQFGLQQLNGGLLVQAYSIGRDTQIFQICTPSRPAIDLGLVALTSPVSGPNLGASEAITLRFQNFGLSNASNIKLAYRLNQGPWKTELYPGVVTTGSTIEHAFSSTENLSLSGGEYFFELNVMVPGDQEILNDTLKTLIRNRPKRDLEVNSIRGVGFCNDFNFEYLEVLVQNNGLGNLHTFDLGLKVNGVHQSPVATEVAIAPDTYEFLKYFVPGLQAGENLIEVDLTNVNGLGEDERPDNDLFSTTYTLKPGGFQALLVFVTDQTPEQNTWEIRDDQNTVISSGGPYPDAGQFYPIVLCLKRDQCYTFHLFDTAGDGIPDGHVYLQSSTDITYWVYQHEAFGAEKVFPFCTSVLCGGFSLEAMVECPAPDLGKITAKTSGGTPNFRYSLNGGPYQTDPEFSNLTQGLYALKCEDAIGCIAEKSIDVCSSNPVLETPFARNLVISPNPTSGIAVVELPALDGEESVLCEVFDVKGKLVQQARLVRWDNRLHGMVILDKVASGLYLLRVKGSKHVWISTLVKQ